MRKTFVFLCGLCAVGFVARRRPDAPDANRGGRSFAREKLRNDFFFQRLERFFVAEKIGYGDEKVAASVSEAKCGCGLLSDNSIRTGKTGKITVNVAPPPSPALTTET